METPMISSRNSNLFQMLTSSALPVFVRRKKEGTIVDRHFVDSVCLERVEASGRRAIVYRRNTNIAFRRYEVDFDILNVVYVAFAAREKTSKVSATVSAATSAAVEVHLCIVGEWRIDFHELAHEGHCMLTLPFRICMAHRCGFGLLLERDSFSTSSDIEPDSAQLFSLTHPYNEFFPVVSKFRGDTQCHYAFRGRRIVLVADSWRADNVERCETIVGECLETGQRLVFLLRACSKEEKSSANNEMWMDARGFFNLSITSGTAGGSAAVPAAAHSFLSPNFFNTKFLTGCRGTASTAPLAPSSSAIETISPLTSQASFASAGRVSFGGVSFIGGGGAATTASGGASSRVTPIRRHGMQTRSMAAAHSLPRPNNLTVGGGGGGGNRSASSLGIAARRIDFAANDAIVASGGGLPSDFANASAIGGNLATAPSMASLNSAEMSMFNRRRSMTSNTLLQFALTQQRRLRCTSTPITDVETERLLAFGNAATMECAVEFCLEWLEDAPPAALAAGRPDPTLADTFAVSSMSSSAAMDCSSAVGVAETPSQPPPLTASQRLASTAKKPAAAAILERRARQQRLQMLDDLLLNKANVNSIYAWKLRESSASMLQSEEARYCRQRWGDNRLQNVRQMLDSSKAVLIPAKLDIPVDNGDASPSSASAGVDERAQQVQFVMMTALKTVTRPFGQALLNFATVRPIANQPFVLNPICLSGKVSPSEIQIDYPTGENSSKAFIEWASFYNGVAHGLAVLGFDSFTRHCARRTRRPKPASASTAGAATRDLSSKQRRQSFGSASAGMTFFSTVRRRQSERFLSVIQPLSRVFSDLSTFLGSPIGLASEGGADDTTQATSHLAEELANFRRESRQPNSTCVVLDWDWLNMNLKAHRDLPPVEAGFLFAAGLSGHIPITNHDVYNYVANYKNKFCVMAILLGWAVAHRGTSDIVVHKVLITHTPFLMQPTLCDFRFEPMIQTAALIGLGFLFADTMNLSLSSQLVNQMSRETFDTEQGVADRYSFVLAAGFAVGLINLGKGTIIMRSAPAVASAQLSLAERLVKLLNGGERFHCYVHYDRAHRCPDVGCAGGRDVVGAVDCGSGGDPQRRLADGTAGDGTTSEHAFTTTSSHVRQLGRVNVHLASPAACAALALLYLRTNDAWISDALSVPDTMPAIERIRPDVLMLRVVAKCLVNFDAIGASIRFVEAQIPSIIRRYATHFVNNTSKKREAWWARVVDVNCVAQAYFYCSAGACMAIALRYASTCDPSAKEAIETFYGRVESEAAAAATDENCIGVDVFRRLGAAAGRNCINACLNVCAVSLALVMAGSGDLATLKLLRKIRNTRRPDGSAKSASLHSLHVATNMAIGMLCLGNGRLSLDKSDMSIASLFISLFPLFPHSLLDNRAYLQPLRFLWTLAVETRFLTAVDAETLAPITVSVRVTFKNRKQPAAVGWTPFILPPLSRIMSITLGDMLASAAVDRRMVGDALFDYAAVELNMRSARDVRKLSDVLNRCYGRLPMRRRAGRVDVDETMKPTDLDDLEKLVGDTLQMLKSQKFGLEEELLSGADDDDAMDAMDDENLASA